MQLSPKGAAFIGHGEGFVGRWYLDPIGVPTIGIGFTWRSAAFREWWKRNRVGQSFAKGATMTRIEAASALIFICEMEYGRAVNVFLNRAVPQNVFDGALSSVYNLGPGSLKWKWAQALKAGNIKEAAALLRATGTTANGKKLNGLIARRKEEAELIENGDYSYDGSVFERAATDGVLVRGERGDAVRDLQQALSSIGLYDGVFDGIFGYGTESAVLAFQRSNGLIDDGRVGPVTLTAIKASMPIPSNPAEPIEPPLPSEKRGGYGLIIFFVLIALAALYIVMNWRI